MDLERTASTEEVHAAVRKLVEKMRKPSFKPPEPLLVHPDDYHLFADHEGHCVWLSLKGDDHADDQGDRADEQDR